MNEGIVMELGRQGIMVGLMVTMPVLAVALFTGLLVSVFQAVTQVQEMTLTYVPKLAGTALVIIALGNWMLQTMVRFMHVSFDLASRVGGG